MVSWYNLLATQFNKTSFGEVRFCFGKNASPALHFSKEVKAASRQGSSAFFGVQLRLNVIKVRRTKKLKMQEG